MKNLIDVFKMRLKEIIENIEFDYKRNIENELVPIKNQPKVRIKIIGNLTFNTNWIYNPCFIKTKTIFLKQSEDNKIEINTKLIELLEKPKNITIKDYEIIGTKNFEIKYRKIFPCYLVKYSLSEICEIFFEEI